MKRRKALTQVPVENKRRRNTEDDTHIEDISVLQPALQSGAIIQMVLKDFMCHSLLEVSFDKNVNIIVGKNGSGKSAILTALIIGLGAKASATNRGQSIKGFIKAGRTSANIKIVLNNRGVTSYRPSIYGNEIIIERHISQSGSNYKVRASSGEIISNRAKEVQTIMMNLNIQVDNPICILTQDMARSFLSTCDPKAMYSLYIKATRLEILQAEHRQSVLNKRESIQIFKDKKELHNEIKKELRKLKEKLECFQNLEQLTRELTELEYELSWSKVVEAEDKLKQQINEIERVRVEVKSFKNNMSKKKEITDSIMESVSNIQRQMNEINESRDAQSNIIREHKVKLSKLSGKLSNKRNEKRITVSEIESKEREKKRIKNEIDNYETRLTEFEQKKRENAQALEKLQEDRKKLKEKTGVLENEAFQLGCEIKRMEDEFRSAIAHVESVKSEKSRMLETINNLRQESSNPLAIYGREMVALNEAIKRSKRQFSQAPIGPLGQYISVKDKKWRLAVENIFGRSIMSAFCVNNDADCKVLLKLLNQVWTGQNKPMIITSKFINRIHDVSRNIVRPIDDCLSVFDAISVSNPVVMNCLIDQIGIESILLVPDDATASALLKEASRVPRNCSKAYTTQGDNYYPDPSYKVYPASVRQARYLQVDLSQVINQYEDRMSTLDNTIKQTENKREMMRDEIKHRKERLKEINSHQEKCERMESIIMNKISEKQLHEEFDARGVNQLDEDIAEINLYIEQKNAQNQALSEEIKQIEEKVLAQEETIENVEETIKTYSDRLSSLDQEIRTLHGKKEELQMKNTFDRNKEEKSKQKLAELIVSHDQYKDSIERLMEEALQFCQRMPEIRGIDVLMDKITKLRRKIQAETSKNEDPEVLLEQYREKNQLLQETEELLEGLLSTLEQLTSALDKRKRIYVSTRDYLENYVQVFFKNFLKLRQFEGTFNINYEEKVLNLVVMPQRGTQTATSSGNLSGGERSFSTVAFLYSLWQSVNFPFYLLDEFDVFMDKVNRTKVMEILIHHAKDKKDTQFIFLTPQDISFVRDNDVSLHRLEDPERRTMSQS